MAEKTNSMPTEQLTMVTTLDDQENHVEKVTTVDTLHADEATVVLARHTTESTWTESEEKNLVRKIDRRLLGIMFATYGLQYYDKAMLSQAALFGLRKELVLTGDRYSFSASIFYLGYIAGALPAMLLAQHFPVERFTAGIIAVWCSDFRGLYAQRFFLGFLEAGVSPILMIIVSSFYKKNEQPLRMGSWWAAAGFVSIFAPLINYGLGHIHGALSTWKYMYTFAGSVTILWAIVIMAFLPPNPVHARGFSERERYIAVARLRTNNTGVRNTHFKPAQALELVYDARFWLAVATAFCIMVTNGPLSTFVPIIVSGFGYSPLNSLLLSMPCGAVAGVETLLVTWIASKLSHRNWNTWIIAACQVPSIVAAVLPWQLPADAQGARLFALYLLGGFASPYGVLMALHTANYAGYTKKSVTASGLFMGYCLGNSTGPLLFKPTDAPTFEKGFQAVLITTILGLALAVAYRFVCVLDNKRRDRAGTAEAFDHAFDDDLTDMKVRTYIHLLGPKDLCNLRLWLTVNEESPIPLYNLRKGEASNCFPGL
ncbi:putative transporter [Cyphellophora attinorum]|uniref:Putative transporter n=1 Tax=Cyphellophora attinorum TaxID=1664694 RepID=A0A0N1NZ59_9EURO|nr:putative transporter [Phialophora attinorum]KPI37123.1 putative transporter [Phialophora attinorum]